MRLTLPRYSEYLLLLILIWLIPDFAYAGANQNSVANVLCKVGSYIWGPVGSLIAVLGVISLGLIAMFGRIQISSVLTVMAGIALIFGAKTILNNMGISVNCGAGTAATGIMNSQFYRILACIVEWFIGPLGKSLGTLAMIMMGLFATYGRISWHQALLVSVGIATMFGSVSIVGALGVNVVTHGGANATITYSHLCGSGALENIFCNVVNWFTGAIGKGIVTLGVIVLGIGALFGKISWPMAMIVALGVAMIFGSTSIIKALGGYNAVLGCRALDIY